MSARDKRARAKERRRAEQERQRELQQQRDRQARRRRIMTVTSAAAVVVLVAVVIGVVVQRQRSQDEGPAPTGVVAGGTAIPVGDADAPVTLTVYEDFRCPACKMFEEDYGKSIDELVDEGTLRVEYHPATVIDSTGEEGSKVAGNAVACAQDAGGFREYHAKLFANQPLESEDGFTVDRVLELAKGVEGLDTDEFRGCVDDERYRPWLKRVQAEMDKRFDQTVTPTVVLDGKVVYGGPDRTLAAEARTPEDLTRTVTKLAGKTASASPSPS